ncbi:MAG: ATP-dependent helicase HrpB [Puniceicoccales bacterium]|jgi:ATP-dependent helicase HrpB|nr:ATP-dependent helicase HrpB [Puniceicoccales bacterium]
MNPGEAKRAREVPAPADQAQARHQLPISAIRETLAGAASHCRRIVLEAPTGSGKSTQVPQFLIDGQIVPPDQKVIVLQPRRLATRMLAARIAAERGQQPGGEVGYQIRFDRVESPQTRIKFVTEGLLLRQMLADPRLHGVGALVFDEFHERHLDSDIALALARHIQETGRPDLLLVVMSATLDTAGLIRWFSAGAAPGVNAVEHLRVGGRLHPIEIDHAPPPSTGPGAPPVWEHAATQFRKAFHAEPEGDFLVFMPGAYEIQRTLDAISATPEGRDCLCLPLHGELPPERQDAAIAPAPDGRRKVVVATNVAETSLTIDGVRVVIDSGLARVARHDPLRGINTLHIENISQASASQRAGRAGRTAPGLCIRLWSRANHEARPAGETPEVRRVELAGPVLSLIAGGLVRLGEFPWFEAPEPRSLARALGLLEDLGAIEPAAPDGGADPARRATPTGMRMAAFPMHPRYSRMLLDASGRRCVPAVATIAAIAQGRDIMLPLENRRDADARAELLGDSATSDFSHRIALLNLARRNNYDAGFCRRLGIHAQGARLAARLAEQFISLAKNLGLDLSASADDPDAVRKCLLAGFGDHIAMRLDKGTLRCALIHGRKAELRRQSAVREHPLLVAAEVDEIEARGDVTTYLGMATAIEEPWLAEVNPRAFGEQTRTFYDAALRRCVTRRERRFHDLVLRAKDDHDPPPTDATARLLAAEILAGRVTLEHWGPAVEAWISKVNYAARNLPELEIPPIDEDARRLILETLCHGSTAAHQVRGLDPRPHLRGWLTDEQNAAISALLPDRITLPYKQRGAAIVYTDGGEAVVGARLQDLYDTPGSHFRIAAGKLPLTIEIQSPARRTVQRTTDLDAFWKTSYALVRKDLRGRYPKHEWR